MRIWVPLIVFASICTAAFPAGAVPRSSVPSQDPVPSSAAPLPSPPPHSRPPVAPEVGLGTLQLVAGYVAEVGGVAGVFALGLYPKGLGWGSDGAAAVEVGVLAPAFAAGAVCGVGRISRSFRGRCFTTFLGAYLGATAGALLGIAIAPSPGPDDTQAFVSSIYAVAGFLLFAPAGAVIGYHLGKEEIRPEPSLATPPEPPMPSALQPPSGAQRYANHGPAPALMVPVVSLVW